MTQKKLKLLGGLLVLLGFFVWSHLSQSPAGQVLSGFDQSSSTDARLVFFDVGQGDASLIIAPDGEKILIDGGPDKSIVNKLDKLLNVADRKIDYVILTHPHADHVAGLPEVVRCYQIGRVIMTGAVHTAPDYLDFLNLIKEKNIPATLIDKPQEMNIGGMTLKFLEPTESYLEKRLENLNNSSIVFKLVYASTSVLYMGDFENEESLLSQSAIQLKSDLIKIGHHGSANANDRNFLKAVAPAYAVVSAGKNNRFGHPHYRTLYYLQQLKTEIFRTDEKSDIIFISDGAILKPVQP